MTLPTGTRLRALSMLPGSTYAAVAAELRVSTATVARWANLARRRPNPVCVVCCDDTAGSGALGLCAACARSYVLSGSSAPGEIIAWAAERARAVAAPKGGAA